MFLFGIVKIQEVTYLTSVFYTSENILFQYFKRMDTVWVFVNTRMKISKIPQIMTTAATAATT